jgi:hypothetical protein
MERLNRTDQTGPASNCQNQPRCFTFRAIYRQDEAADVSRHIQSAIKMTPTDVGGYAGMKRPGQAQRPQSIALRPVSKGTN